MGYNKSNSKQQNTYIGETGSNSPLLGLAAQIQKLSNQKQAQQNLLFGGAGYGGSFQNQDQREWGKIKNNPAPYPNAKPYGGWGGYEGGSPGFGSDNPVMNPGAGGRFPSWRNTPWNPQSSGGGSGGLQQIQETSAKQSLMENPTQKNSPVVMSGPGDFMESRTANTGGPTRQSLGADPGPSGGDYTPPTYPFRYKDRAQQIKDMMARKPGAYSEGAQETLLNKLASPWSEADPGVEAALRAQNPGMSDKYSLVRDTNARMDYKTGGYGLGSEDNNDSTFGGVHGSERVKDSDVEQAPGMPGYRWVRKDQLDPAKWRRNAGF